MNSTLKVLIPLALLVAVVFAVTFFSIYTPRGEDENPDKAGPAAEPPLRFFSSERRWNPFATDENGNPVSLQDRIFPGSFEPGETQHATAFWFANRNPQPVRVQLKGVNCGSCSGGRLAPIPPEAAKALLQVNAAGLLPLGPLAGCPVGAGEAAANLFAGLQWQSHSFNQDPAQVGFTVPGAADADGWSPQWGILELNFKVRPNPITPLQAAFATQVEGTDRVGTDLFKIFFEAVDPVDVDTPAINLKELSDDTPPQAYEFTVFSKTRTEDGLADLTVRSLLPGGAPDLSPFVAVGRPVPIRGPQFDRFAAELAARVGQPVRVVSAFRVPVTVSPKVGDARADIGQLEREIWVSVGNAEPKRVAVKGTVRGPVRLSQGQQLIDLGRFKGSDGTTWKGEVVTDRTGMELAVVPDECRPRSLQASLKKLPDRDGQGQYELRVKVPPNDQYGEIAGGVVVLEVKGPTPQRIRLPVKGLGTLQ